LKLHHDGKLPLLALAAAWLFGFALLATPLVTFASEPGTIGVAVNQLYSEQQPTKRGAFMVRRVDPSSAAADAGIQPGDLILAIDGKRVFNTEESEVTKKIAGPAGSSIELSVVQADGNLKKITLVRKPFPPHLNPLTDTFSYSIPGNWQVDPRYNFPLPWSPGLAFKGFEDLYFAPGFDDLDSPEYHSYLFLWWLEGKQQITAAELASDIVIYFRGLAQQRGRNNSFEPDLSQIAAEYATSTVRPSTLGGTPATSFNGTVTLYDRRGRVIALHSEVTLSFSTDGHTAVLFLMSKEPRPSALWSQLDAIRDGFRYRR
jgi:PDZ domain